MNITALGTHAAYAGPGNACTGWLVQDGGVNLLLDCGTGVIARLQQVLPPAQITAIVISHLHADHFFDLTPLRHALRYGPNPEGARPTLLLPPGGQATLAGMSQALHWADEKGAGGYYEGVFDLREYRGDEPLRAGHLELRFAPGVHYIPSWAVAVRSLEAGGRSVAYTGDTGPSDAVAELAARADLLIAEATYLSLDEEGGPQRGHMTGFEAGELAAKARVAQALVTHQWPHRPPGAALAQAKQRFSGPIDDAQPGACYKL